MPLNLLFDLDDTLLDNDQNAFFAAFYSTLTGSLSRHAGGDELARAMQSGVQAMFLNNDPARTLAEAFYQGFLAEAPLTDAVALRTDVDTYYREVYPALCTYTAPRPAAIKLVEWAFSQGYRIGIVTNPLFTRFAVEERLRWAGLPPEKYPFALLTTNESFHFVKSPAYYAEVMGRLGWPEDPVLVVGDDLHLDVIPARTLGLAVYHVASSSTAPETGPGSDGSMTAASGFGGIDSLRAWLEAADLASFKASHTSPEAILATLRSTPASLAGLVAEVPVGQWTHRPEPSEWGLTEILCHLRDVDAEVNIPRVEAILKESNPFVAAQETNGWAEERLYAQQDGQEALRVFAETRTQLASRLTALRPEDWRRRARHSVFGPTDLREMAAISAEHDRSHVRQIFQLLRQLDRRRA